MSNQELAVQAPLTRSVGAPAPLAGEHPGRECDCHPWVRCRHFDGLVVELADSSGSTKGHVAGTPLRYRVAGPAAPFACGCGADRITRTYALDESALYTDDLSVAKAEFDQRSLALMGRSDD